MKSIADQLPPEIARQLHPDRRKNETEYWTVRDQLLQQYQDQWIGFADGRVIASGTSPVTVLHAAEASGRHPFVICVGHEEEPCRIRRASFAYDAAYRGEALPLIQLEFREASGKPGPVLDRVIPDTGADASVLPWMDCQLLQLTPASGVQALISGVAGASAATLTFHIWAFVDGREYLCRVQADFVGTERILGRDVLNRLDLAITLPQFPKVLGQDPVAKPHLLELNKPLLSVNTPIANQLTGVVLARSIPLSSRGCPEALRCGVCGAASPRRDRPI